MRLRPSHFSSGVTGEEEQERPAVEVQPSQCGLLMDGMAAILRKSRELYQHKILIALVFFCIKVCMVSNKEFKPKFVLKWPGSV